MRCHDILGIREKASDTEIQTAYYKKKSSLGEIVGIGSPAYDKKLSEIRKAKEDCLSWHHKSFISRTSERFREMSTSAFSSNQLNELCLGPCTCCDICCGAGCNSRNDSFCVDCCGISVSGLSPAVFCDIGIDIAIVSGIYIAISKDRKEKREHELEEEKKRMEEQRAALVITLQSRLAQGEEQLKETESKCADLRKEKSSLQKYSQFFMALSTSTNMKSTINLLPITKMIQEDESQILELENRITQIRRENRDISLQIKENSGD